jgi:PadR family transcriptional regulator AphA
MARESKTQYAILGCLFIKPMTAYEIKQFMNQYTNHFWSEREGQLYPTFKQLLEDELVSFTEELAQKNGIKKVYCITNKGKTYFNHWFNSATEVSTERNATLLKLFFGRSQPTQKTIDMLVQSLESVQEKQSILFTIQGILENKVQHDIDVSFYQLALNYGLATNSATKISLYFRV